MKTKIGAVIIAWMFLFGTVPLAMAKGPGGGSGGGAAVRSGVGTKSQNQIRTQQRLRDGSCVNQGTGTPLKKGNAYGPGDGTGTGVPAQDGTGYGAPANR